MFFIDIKAINIIFPANGYISVIMESNIYCNKNHVQEIFKSEKLLPGSSQRGFSILENPTRGKKVV